MTLRRTIVTVIALSLLVCFLPKTGLSQEKVRLGFLQSDLHQLASFIARKKGFYKDENLNVSIGGIFKAGPEEMSAFASGSLDVGYVGSAPAVVAVANKVADVKIIAQVNLEGSAIVVRKGSEVESLGGLVGKTVAVPGYGQVQDFLLRKGLAESGIDIKSVNIIIIKPPEMIPTLEGDQIEAFVAWEPYPSKAITKGVGKVLVYSGEVWSGHPCCVVVADSEFLKERSPAIRKLLKAHIRATNYIKKNPQEAIKLGAEFTGMDIETVKLGIRHIVYEYRPEKKGLLEYVNFLKKLDMIKVGNPREFVDNLVYE